MAEPVLNPTRGRLFGKNVLEGVFRAEPDEDLFLGELLVAVRDAEERVRFLGYNPANVKLAAIKCRLKAADVYKGIRFKRTTEREL